MLGSRKKAKFPNYNFPTTSIQVRIREVKLQKVGLRKAQAKFQKEDVEEGDGGR